MPSGKTPAAAPPSRRAPVPALYAALGASAGGLEAFEKFFRSMPADSGIAFMVVQHLSPQHVSALPEIIGGFTEMETEQVTADTPVLPNRVYIIAPNATLTIKDGILRVAVPAEARGHRTPINNLFRSLAEDQGESAVCIMFSGTGTDGTLGVRAIKEHGGMAMAQSLETARYDAILRSAIATGLVDHVLPAEQLAAKLLEYTQHLAKQDERRSNGDLHNEIDSQLDRIHSSLRQRTGHDFSHYKEGTTSRRLERRMKVLQIESIDEYVAHLESEPEEADRLFKDLLIGVTHFFRDPQAYDALAKQMLPAIFSGKTADDEIRAWIIGCGSGEEAYSVAMLLCEQAAKLHVAPRIKVFATDIDERALDFARWGRYDESIAQHVGPERLERFFTRSDGYYKVRRDLRDRCFFSNHSFIKNPPFSRQQLISCRNVMIYLGADLQQKLIPLFHYALDSKGFLFLGPSENIGSHRELFRTVDKKHRVFQRKDAIRRPAIHFPLSDIRGPLLPEVPHARSGGERVFATEMARIILQRYGPTCVLVKENGDAVYFSGKTSRYLEHPTGGPDLNILNMAREELRMPLRSALHRAASSRERSAYSPVQVRVNGGVERVEVVVEPLDGDRDSEFFIVIFEQARESRVDTASAPGFDARADEVIRRLEGDLRTAQDHLQGAIEEMETANEELRSTNEEFQSTNEELETSKEELQSFNEELETVNVELNRKVNELDHVNGDLQNLLDNTQIATIFLDQALNIKNFTPAISGLFRLIATDVGRPITDLAAGIPNADLVSEIRTVQRTLKPIEKQVSDASGHHYQMRVLPYRTVHDAIDGVVITFVDVTWAKEAALKITDAKTFAESIVHTVTQPMLVLDDTLKVVTASRSYRERFGVNDEETVGKCVYDLGDGHWDVPELRKLGQETSGGRELLTGFELERSFPGLGLRTMLLSARAIDWQGDRKREGEALILLVMEDITERKLAERLLQQLNDDLRYFAYAASHDLREPLRMVAIYLQLITRRAKDELSEQATQYVENAVDAAARMETLLIDLRNYWAVDEAGVEKSAPVDCNTALDRALGFLGVAASETGAQITREELPTVLAEEVPVVTVFQNLIANAIRYRREGEPPRVHIAASNGNHASNGNGHFCTISVRDNGIGIEEQYYDQIFLPFKRLHGNEKSGNGMGLAICRKIVNRYGGRIWAQPHDGHGVTICFDLPLPEPTTR